jgi:hypothetical protein
MSLGSSLPFLILTISLVGNPLPGIDIQHQAKRLNASGDVMSDGQGAALLDQQLADGEALVWYLGHRGWAVKTRTSLLIFDYWEQEAIQGEPSLSTGRVNPAELRATSTSMYSSVTATGTTTIR